MKTLSILKHISKTIGILMLVSGSVAIASEGVSTQEVGKLEFQRNCASCHGMNGKGNGPFVELLKQAPPDLTLMSKKYGGIYPLQRVYDWISDVQHIRAHGTHDMPIWGERYNQQIVKQVGPMYTGPSNSASERVLELVFYIGTIQQKP